MRAAATLTYDSSAPARCIAAVGLTGMMEAAHLTYDILLLALFLLPPTSKALRLFPTPSPISFASTTSV
jgi:hypothetical protein